MDNLIPYLNRIIDDINDISAWMHVEIFCLDEDGDASVLATCPLWLNRGLQPEAILCIEGVVFSYTDESNPEAISALKEAVKINEAFTFAWYCLGELLSKNPLNHLEAEEALKKAIFLDEWFPDAWNDLGVLLSNYPGRLEEAENAYLTAMEMDPEFAAPLNNLGSLLLKHPSRRFEAENLIRKALE